MKLKTLLAKTMLDVAPQARLSSDAIPKDETVQPEGPRAARRTP